MSTDLTQTTPGDDRSLARESCLESRDVFSLRHGVANDLNAVAMTLEALSALRDDAQQFDELVQLMRANVQSLKWAYSALTEAHADSTSSTRISAAR